MNQSNLYLIISTLILMLFPTVAFAELSYIDPVTGQSVLDQVAQKFGDKARGWQTVLEAAATRLFWTLVLISMVWTFGMMILRKADIGDFFAEFTRFIIFTGFFFWLLSNAVSGQNIGGTIIDSMQVLGNQASGQFGSAHGSIIDVVIRIWYQLSQSLSVWNPIDSLIAIILTIIITIILTVIAVNVLFLLISAWVLLYAGIFLLGFGGARWTSDIAINYFRTVLSVGIQLLAMTLIVGIGSDFLTSFHGKMNQNLMNLEELVVMLVFSIAFFVLTTKIPPMLSGIVTGGGFNSSGVSNYSGGQVMGAAATSMALASMGKTKAAGPISTVASLLGGEKGSNSAIDAAKSVASGSQAGDFSTSPRKGKGVSNYPFGQRPERPS